MACLKTNHTCLRETSVVTECVQLYEKRDVGFLTVPSQSIHVLPGIVWPVAGTEFRNVRARPDRHLEQRYRMSVVAHIGSSTLGLRASSFSSCSQKLRSVNLANTEC